MRRAILIGTFLFIFFFYYSVPRLSAQAELAFLEVEPAISLDFQNVSLRDLLKIFSIQSGLNFIASDAVQQRTLTLYMDKVPLGKAMEKIFWANGLSYDLDQDSNIFVVKDLGTPDVETVTRVFSLKYASVSTSKLKKAQDSKGGESESSSSESSSSSSSSSDEESSGDDTEGGEGITAVIKKLISSHGSVLEDSRTNSLIVVDLPSRMKAIAETIEALDVAVPQVMLEVEMLDVNKNTLERMGVKFGDITDYPSVVQLTMTGGSRYTAFPWKIGKWVSTDENPFGENTPGSISANSLGLGNYRVLLDFIKSISDTRYLARPRLLTLSNETAELKISTNEAIGTVTIYDEQGNAQSQNPERTETGVSLKVTPQVVAETGVITLFVHPKVTEAATSNLSASYRDPEERGTQSTVRVNDGETIIIGGLIRNRSSETITKVPFLGDMPLVGSFFRHKNKSQGNERELLIFITPRIMKDKAVRLVTAKSKKMVLPEREQNTASLVSRELAIRSSLDKFDRKPR